MANNTNEDTIDVMDVSSGKHGNGPIIAKQTTMAAFPQMARLTGLDVLSQI